MARLMAIKTLLGFDLTYSLSNSIGIGCLIDAETEV